MIKRIFEAIESFFKAVVYMLVLTIGMTVASLATYTVCFCAFRLAQFLWLAFFAEPWL
jgi:hypothetical protein